MHGAGPRRGFAPDDARAGTGGGGRAPTRFRRDAENMRTTVFGPGTPRGPRERFPCFLCRHRQAALCSVRRGAALCHLVVAPSGSPGPLGPPALGREGEGKFRGAGGCVGLVSSRRTGQSGACLGRCSHSHGASRSAHGLLPASRKSRGGSPSLQKAQDPEHRGAHQGGTPRVVGASGCPAGDAGEGERATPCSRHTGDLRPRAERTARPRRDPGAQVGRAAPSSPSALGTATVAFGMKGGTARASGELGRSHVLRGPSHAGGRRPERFPLPSGAKSLPVGAGFLRVAPLQAETKVEGPLHAERTNVTPGKATATTVPCHRPQKPRLRTPPRCHGLQHRRDLLRANGAAPP